MSLCKNWYRTFSADAISCYQQPCFPQITYKKKKKKKQKMYINRILERVTENQKKADKA